MIGHFRYFLATILLFIFTTIGYASNAIFYSTKISNNDRYNSSGHRLTSVAAILRQDRANYYKFNLADRGDQGDGYFYSKSRRQIFSHVRVRVASGWLRKRIVSPGKAVWVSVAYYPNQNLIRVDQPG